MDVRRAGYARYELLVSYLLDRRKLSVAQMLARPLEQRQVESELEAEPRL